MSRVGKRIIEIPSDVTVDIDGSTVTVKGPKGELVNTFNEEMTYELEDNTLQVVRPSDSKDHRTNHGTTRALINNMVVGVSQGFSRELELVGVGYRAQMQGKKLVLNVGLSHPVEFEPSEDLSISVDGNTNVKVEGINKESVGALASKIRSVRPPEPYKGKGIRYKGEQVRRKEGKTGK
ncbi:MULTISPECIES: 50S ribosomal protein L6 [Salinicoccus]|jgi:large subunit ribosomal protein L6|uniref:Large ribosomal subunit protein uL6 n=1 Tax=Salinicoccus roseus TaxID=45670 RepID=A0A0C2HBW4_9STAP|nr:MULTISPECIES: 50S ribosomal protein L6 [Salinicoccus]KIH71220.1 50S ribosomal protein L6 [Salinicoccus roseus]MBY8909569.1 50S ribosomal protein L6 [Salinicoccus roseus]MCC4723736.1 50S ribosomal protein L6 [Salinicoccus sp. RF5]MCG7331435.1 50S ribosomal protein L6 [Salinicoccus roseus]MDB0579950.1 50S ribosomal protein L6 [Salinicoccus roseus]|tara:strand:- start:219 stop:755 length:537 start_codon:yes stop_codon:yes gene_type:complete